VERRDDNPAEESNRERKRFMVAFESCMEGMSGNYNREFTPAAQRLYLAVCEGWSAWKMRDVFRRAIEGEKFCPTVATLKAYGAGVREENERVVEVYKAPRFTAEEAADIAEMRKDLVAKFAAMPWSRPL
jgi:hypothetical protein